MENLLYYLQALVLITVLIFISVEDYKYHKIYNKRIFHILWAGIFFYFGTSLLSFLDVSIFAFPTLSTFLFSIKSFFISLLVSYTLWHFHLWGAGDAKLFIALSFALPPYFYQAGSLETFPTFPLLINIFFPLMLIIVFRFFLFPFSYGLFLFKNPLLFHRIVNDIVASKKNWVTKEKLISYLKYLLGFLCLFILFQLVRSFVFSHGISFDLNSYIFLFVFTALIFSFHKLRKLLENNCFILALSLLVGLYFLYLFFTLPFTSFLSQVFYIVVLGTAIRLLIFLLIFLYRFYIDFMETIPVKVSELQPGVILDTQLGHSIGYEKLGEYILSLKNKVLTKVHVKKLQKLFGEYYEFQKGKVVVDTLRICKVTHFGIWFLLGILITCILQNSVINFIVNLV